MLAVYQSIEAGYAFWLFMEFLRVIDVFETMGPGAKNPARAKVWLFRFVFVLYLDGRQCGGRSGLIAVDVTCFDTEALTLSASSNFYFIGA